MTDSVVGDTESTGVAQPAKLADAIDRGLATLDARLGSLRIGGEEKLTLILLQQSLDEQITRLGRTLATARVDHDAVVDVGVAEGTDRLVGRVTAQRARLDELTTMLTTRLAATNGNGNGHGTATAVPRSQALRAVLLAPSEAQQPGGRLLLAGRIVTLMGVLFTLFVVFLLLVTPFVEARSQRLLLGRFRQHLEAQRAAVAGGNESLDASSGAESGVLTGEEGSGATPSDDAATKPAPPIPSPGDPVALLQIDALDLEEVVVEGTSAADLRHGPGHYRSTSLPGQIGNAAIAGRRVAYGGVFRRLDELEEGDEIAVTTAQGEFTFVVDGPGERVDEGDPDPTRPTAQDQLTLVTSDPPFLASERFVVTATLEGKPVARSNALSAVDANESGFGLDKAAIAPTILWFLLLAGTFLAARMLYRHWRRWPTWLLTTPVLVALLFGFFESLSSLLPATL